LSHQQGQNDDNNNNNIVPHMYQLLPLLQPAGFVVAGTPDDAPAATAILRTVGSGNE